MTQHIQGKDGLFAGSIGDGKTNVPTPTPAVPGSAAPAADESGAPRWAALYSKYAEAVKNPPTGLIDTVDPRDVRTGLIAIIPTADTVDDSGCGTDGCCGSGVCTPDSN
jgi:hypothetical protein